MPKEKPSNQEQLDILLRRALADKHGIRPIIDKMEKLEPLLDKVGTFTDAIKGEPGETPVAGKDYFTEQEKQDFLEQVTPRKGEHYVDGAPGADGYTPVKGVDYLTTEEMAQILKDATPIKGQEYFTPEEIMSFKAEVTPQKGVDYVDGQNPTVGQFLETIKGLKGQDAADFSQNVGRLIDISHVRNAGTFIFNGKKYKTEELMHGGGSGGSGGQVNSVIGTTNRITVDSTDPANPIVDIAATYVGQTSITTLGTITTGVWSGTVISLAKGGTGADLSGVAKGGLISGTGAGTVGITTVGADGTVLSADSGSAGGIKWIAAGGTGTVTSVSVVTANGFSGTVATATTTPAITINSSLTVNGKAITSSPTLSLASADFANQGTTTTVLHGNAAGNPAFGAVVEADITLANNTTNNVSITKHGFTPILPGNPLLFFDGNGNYSTPTAGVANSYSLTAFSGQTSINVIHNFGTYPVVQVIDNTGAVVIPLTTVNNTLNDFTVTFTSSTTGSIIASVGSPQPQAVTVASGNYAILTTDRIITSTGAGSTITLPTAVANTGREFIVDNASPGNITVDTTGGQTIEGDLTQTVPSNSAINVYSTGAVWRIY